jgi:hypothetical protein
MASLYTRAHLLFFFLSSRFVALSYQQNTIADWPAIFDTILSTMRAGFSCLFVD